MWRVFALRTASRAATSVLPLPQAPVTASRRLASTSRPPALDNDLDDWTFDDDDFMFLDEMLEGRLESPQWIPEPERRQLERERLGDIPMSK